MTEGTAASFTVTADPAPSANLTVNLSVSEAAGSDFVASGDEGDKSVTIIASSATATYSVTTQNDSADEQNGSVTVQVSTGTGYTVGSTASATVTVNDDDHTPVFTNQAATASVAENSGGGTAVVTIKATDADTGDTVTHSLDTTSDAVFDIDGSSGAITVQNGADLNHEGTQNYTARVTATDGTNSATHTVTISVTDQDEPPDAPAAPTVTGATASSVTVNWTAPTNTGKPAINDYDVQFRVSGATSWTAHAFTGTGTSTTISGLSSGTTYQVQVMAKNAEGGVNWSPNGSGKTSDPTITISGGSAVTEGTAAAFTVTANTAPGANLTVNLSVSEATNSDFVASGDEGTKSVTITASSATANYSVTTQNDSVDEQNGSVTVQVSTGTGYTVGSTASASVTVNDDDHTPVFTSQPTTASVPENSAGSTAVTTGTPPVALTVVATDADSGDTVSHSLDSTSDALFDINSSSGAITVQAGADLNHEGTQNYTARVTATDGTNSATHSVTISVTDVNEPPDAPAAPTVTAGTSGKSASSIDVSWTAPSTTGKPPINGYDVQYQASGATSWTSHSFTGTGTSTTISSLNAATTYQVQVKAKNDEGDRGWSATGSGATKSRPVFTDQPTTATVAENSGGGTAVATAVATDADSGETVTHSLDATSDALFDIDGSSGAITVQSGADLNYEGTQSYTAMVTATDGTNSATHNVAISVTDENEPPDAPAAPTVTSASSTSLEVNWTAPDMTGKPPIIDYDVRFKLSTASEGEWFNHDSVHPVPGTPGDAPHSTATSRTLSNLSYTGVDYDVQVMAINAEGDSPWSASGTGRTTSLTVTIAADSSPVTEGTPATFTVTANPAPSENLYVSLKVSESEGSDFVKTEDETGRLTSKLVLINSGVTTGTHSVPTQDDITDEPNGSVTVRVAADSGYTVGSPDSASVTVNDNDHSPDFTGQPTTASVPENSPGGTAVVTILATDADTGDTVTHSLTRASDAVFDIDSASGAITVGNGSVLDYESPPLQYGVLVTASDGTNSSTHRVTISVTDDDEPPDAPAAPTVTGASQTSVDVTWTAPDVTGKPEITDYNVRYRASSATGWTNHGFTGVGTTTTFSGLTAGTTYEVQVQATNDEGDSDWSAIGRGATDSPTNDVPVFTSPPSSLDIAENNADGANVGTVAATDADGDTLTYSLDSTSDAVFDIDSSGVITVASGVTLDHEASPAYAVVVTVGDGTVQVTHSLTINVTDEAEPPDTPGAPTVTGASQTSVDVSWTAPGTTGRPAITDYNVRYRASGDPDWADAEYDGVATATTISSLAAGTTYEVQVQAANDEGTSGWSATGSSTTDAPTGRAPVFTDQAATASVAENSADGTPVVTVVATDADGDTITHSLDSASDEVFDIDASSGAITVRVDAGSALDHEGTPSYTATVTATDSTGSTATHGVTISVTDVDEPPDAPAAPRVTAASTTSVTVSWTAPDVTGKPAITDYDVRFKLSTETGWTDHGFIGTGTGTTISSLTAGATYNVQVRAKNAEGDSGWSATGSGSPSPSLEKNPPVLERSRVRGATATLEFNRILDDTSVPDPQDFTVTVTGGDAALALSARVLDSGPVPGAAQQRTHDVTAVSIRGSVLDLTVAPAVEAGQGVTLSYTRGTQPLRGKDGDEVADFTVTPANETPANRAPAADAGVDMTAASGAAVTLDGSASADPEGEALTFSWTQTSGAAVTLEGANTAQPSFTAPAQPGALSFRLTVADPGGLTAEDSVTVTVRDDAPDFGSVEVAALLLDQGRAIEPLVLPEAAGGNGALSYSLTSSPAGLAGLAFDPSTRALSGTPQATGSYVFTYRVEDADANRTDADAASLTFQVMVSATADRKKMLTHALGGMGQYFLSNALDNIGDRFAEPATSNRATVAGASLAPPGLLADGAGAGAFGGGPVRACTTGGMDPRAFAFGGVAGCDAWAPPGAASSIGLPRVSDFSWQFGAAPGDSSPQQPRWSLWGRGDLGMFGGRPDSGSGYDGQARAGWLGFDVRTGPWVAGVALSRGTSEADYHFGSGEAQKGQLEVDLTAVYPYARRAFANGVELRGLLGTGSGDARHLPGRGDPENAGLKMRLGSLGMLGPMPSLAGLEINARADFGFVRMETGDGAEAVHGLQANAWRARLGLEASRRLTRGPGSELIPFVEVAGRTDSGDGLEGTGVEVAGGWRYRDRRLEVEGRGRVLVQHSEDGADERGVSFTARLLPRANGAGLSLALTPRWGNPAGLAEALWRHETPWLPGNAGAGTALLDAQAAYGFLLQGGLLTPFVETNLAGIDYRVLRMGVRFDAARMNLQTALLAERYEHTNTQTDHGLRLDLKSGF